MNSEPAFTPAEIAEHRAQWVAALRSGKYKQTRGKLKARNGAMCCLGVAEMLAGTECVWDGGEYVFGTAQYTGILTDHGRDWLGVSSKAGRLTDARLLTDINDKGASFPEIADLIESVGLLE